MPESFSSFHAASASSAASVMSLGYAWGGLEFAAIWADAGVDTGETEDVGSLNAGILKAVKTQFTAYPKAGDVITRGGSRYRVHDDVHSTPNDPYITIRVIEI